MIMGIVLGLAAALLYGASDFAGGVASRRIGELRVTAIDSAAAAVLAAVMLLAYGGPGPTVRAVAWGLASGVAGGAGTLVLYRGMARGQLSVVGPVSAVGAAVVPVLAGIVLGERPGLVSLAGVGVALPAIMLVAASGSVRGRLAAGLPEGLAAGLAFGILFVGLAQAGHDDGLWPVVTEQAGMLLVTVPLVIKSRPSLRVPLRDTILPVLAGATGQAATLAYFYATHFSMLAVAAVLVSLYPGFTVLLARVLLHERFSLSQRFGLGLCALAVTAIALS